MIDEKTVRKVARLARIKVTDEDVTRLTPQVGGIMKWIEQLGEVNTDNVTPLPSPLEVNLRLRPDVVNDGGIQDKVLANAPEALEGFYVVPKVVE
jgi:aspartyl-tRNA(Asn)/glutamyl-tRNA(Gln) amidotransferase subunit C